MNCRSPRKAFINNQETQSTTRSKDDLNQRQFNASSRTQVQTAATNHEDYTQRNTAKTMQITVNNHKRQRTATDHPKTCITQWTTANTNEQQSTTTNNNQQPQTTTIIVGSSKHHGDTQTTQTTTNGSESQRATSKSQWQYVKGTRYRGRSRGTSRNCINVYQSIGTI